MRERGDEVGPMVLGLVFDLHQRCRSPSRFQRFRQHQRERLKAEQNLVVVERPERFTGRCDLVAIATVEPSYVGPVFVGQDIDQAADRARGGFIDARHASLCNRAGHDPTVDHPLRRMLGGIARLAGHLVGAIDAANGAADAAIHLNDHAIATSSYLLVGLRLRRARGRL